MNNRHMPYRQNIYRRRRIRLTLWIVGISAVVLLALFLIIGNLFHKKVSEAPSTTDTDTIEDHKNEPSYPAAIRAAAISPEIEEALSTQMDTATANGYSAVCFPLNQENGRLLYHSDIAASRGYSFNGTSGLTLDSLLRDADTRGLWVSGSFFLPALPEDDLNRSILLAETATVIAEALRAGVDDIVILAPSISEEQCNELVRLADSIRILVPDANIGFSLPHAVIGSEREAETIERLSQSFSFLALQAAPSAESADAIEVGNRVSGMLYYLLRYHMRVLIPRAESVEQQGELIAAVEQNSIENWAILS